MDQLDKKNLDHDIDPPASVHCADMKTLINSYIQQLVQIKWDVAVHVRDLFVMKPTPRPPKKFQHLTIAEEFPITQFRIDIPRPPRPIYCLEDPRLHVTIVTKC